jgi:hypothetical protein
MTYKQLQDRIHEMGAGSVKACWIAHIKSDYGLTRAAAHNRHDPRSRVHPCPPEKRLFIVRALAEAGMITT